MITRDQIFAALDTVAGVVPYLVQPNAVIPGAGWPVWDHAEYANRCVPKETWTVLVALPGGDRSTTAINGDALRVPVAEALFAIPAWVERCEPVQIQVEEGGAAVPALQFTVTE